MERLLAQEFTARQPDQEHRTQMAAAWWIDMRWRALVAARLRLSISPQLLAVTHKP
jgi:hypothetical protein